MSDQYQADTNSETRQDNAVPTMPCTKLSL